MIFPHTRSWLRYAIHRQINEWYKAIRTFLFSLYIHYNIAIFKLLFPYGFCEQSCLRLSRPKSSGRLWCEIMYQCPQSKGITEISCSCNICANRKNRKLVVVLCFSGHKHNTTFALQWRHNERDGVSITGVSIVYSTVCSGTEKKHQSSTSLAFVRGIHRSGDGWIPHTKGQ